jgi:hypothetical protein
MTDFFANPKAPDGHTYDCKMCVNARNSRNYYEHRDHYRKMGAAYYAAHKAESDERTRKSRELKPYRNWAMHTIRNHQSRGYTVSLTYDELEEIAKRTTTAPSASASWIGGRVALNAALSGTRPLWTESTTATAYPHRLPGYYAVAVTG